MVARSRQLHTLTRREFRAPAFLTADGSVHTSAADNVPLVHWPNGSWCFEANRFIRELFERGLSRLDRGGSLSTKSSNISHLLRFCWRLQVDLINLSDNQFREFIGEIMAEMRVRHPEQAARNNNTVISIGRDCLSLLDSVGRHSGDTLFVSQKGQIRGEKKEVELSLSSKKSSPSPRKIVYWDHPAFPKPDAKSRRPPIFKDSIERMRSAAMKIARDTLDSEDCALPRYSVLHTRDRQLVSLLLLEATGARRGEVVRITVESVLAANRMDIPMLRIPTLKKRESKIPYRYVPIARHELKVLCDYIEYSRRPLLRKLKKHSNDHGVLLISTTTGNALSANTITNEISSLAKYAGFSSAASPHLFRHRFITKRFVMLIEEHEIENPEQFRRMLLDGEAMKRKVMEWTGQSLQSIERYIHLAFDEIGKYKKIYDRVSASLVVESAISTLKIEVVKLTTDFVAPEVTTARLHKYLLALVDDLSNTKVDNEMRERYQ